MWESDKKQENITYKTAKRSALSQQVTTRLQETGRQAQNTNAKKKIHKRSIDLEGPVKKVIKFILIKEVCNLNSNLLKSGYDQEIAQSHTADQPTLRKSHRKFTVLSCHQK